MKHFTHLLLRSIGLGQLQIIADGAAHKRVSLGYEAQVAPYRHRSCCGFYKAEYHAEQGSLTNTRLTQDSSLRASLKFMGKVAQYFLVALGIAKGDVIKTDSNRCGIGMSFARSLSLLTFQFLQSIDAGSGMNHPGHHVEHLKNWVLNHAHQLEERSHHTKGDGAVAQADATPDDRTHSPSQSSWPR